MRRRTGLLVGGLVGALVGLVLGWLLLRPSGDDLVAAAHELVPDGFTVEGAGLQRGNVLLGWEDYGVVVATDPERTWDEVAVEDLARSAGWTVVLHDPSSSQDFAVLERSELEAEVSVGTGDGGARVYVQVQRDGTEWLRVALASLVGAVLGGVAGALRRSRTGRTAVP